MGQFFFNGFIQAKVGRPPSWSGWPNDWHFYDHFPKSPVTKLYLFIILSGYIPEIEDGNFKFKLEASKLCDIIICKVFYFPTLWSLNSAHWENIQKEKWEVQLQIEIDCVKMLWYYKDEKSTNSQILFVQFQFICYPYFGCCKLATHCKVKIISKFMTQLCSVCLVFKQILEGLPKIVHTHIGHQSIHWKYVMKNRSN